MIAETGHAYRSASGVMLDAWFPPPGIEPKRSCEAVTVGLITEELIEVSVADLASPPADLADVYLRLHLISRREFTPHQINLDAVFSILPNVAWTNCGPVLPEDLAEFRSRCAALGRHVAVASADKFPRMTDYVLPSGVRIGDADRVRLGAHLAEGTTVMHEGFVNFNAGTLGPSMIEGRISAGVLVGAHSDLGGGASTMGTLSGGGTEIISVGENCLIGANAGIGISLGNNCTIEAGLYITAGTKVTLPDGSIRTGRELSGQAGLLYRRNSQSGAVEVLPSDSGNWQGLNETLHANQ